MIRLWYHKKMFCVAKVLLYTIIQRLRTFLPMTSLISLLLVFCSGCAKDPLIETVFIPQSVPDVLLVPVEKPVLAGDSNAHLADYALRLEEALFLCNGKLKAIGR